MKRLKITVEGHVYEVVVETTGKETPTEIPPSPSNPAPAPVSSSEEGTPVVAPLASVVVEIHVSIGQPIHVGDNVVTIEAMKMNTLVSSTVSGTVKSIAVGKGDSVEEGQALLIIG